MPEKRRIGKGRRLDDYERQQLLDGPDACLLAGVGYLGRFPVAKSADLTADQYQEMLEEMRGDWARYGAELMAWWNGSEDSGIVKPWAWVPARGPGTLPWAATEFGEP